MLVNMKDMLTHANKHHYAVMAMNCINMEMARGAVEAAEEMHSPMIIQMGCGQMRKHAHPEEMVPMIREMGERISAPICLNLDHGSKFDDICFCIKCGFTNVMFDGSALPYEENVERTALICQIAHSQGISVEGELGHVGQAVTGDDEHEDFLTKPELAKDFIERTGVDALAVAIGTAHGNYPKGKTPKLDFERLKEIKKIIPMPLVLHGGSGSGEDNIRKAIAGGINKINVCTDAFSVARAAFLKAAEDGSKDYLAVSVEVEKEVKEYVENYMKLIGSANQYFYGEATNLSKE